jgi:hypothetical protein
LEIELGAQTLAREKGRETTLDFLFKKPFKVAPEIEIMVGLGPAVVWTSQTSWGLEVAADLMAWPWRHPDIMVGARLWGDIWSRNQARHGVHHRSDVGLLTIQPRFGTLSAFCG